MSDVLIFWHRKFLKVAAAEEVLQPAVHVVPLTRRWPPRDQAWLAITRS